MSITKGLFTSNSAEWATPKAFFEELDKKYNFDLDPCATKDNAKCKRYFTKDENGLAQDWGGCSVFCNPPYGRSIASWVEKCWSESRKQNTLVVALLPARTDTKWFHEYIYNKAEIVFLRGRLKFGDGKNSAPFPSMLAIWKTE